MKKKGIEPGSNLIVNTAPKNESAIKADHHDDGTFEGGQIQTTMANQMEGEKGADDAKSQASRS